MKIVLRKFIKPTANRSEVSEEFGAPCLRHSKAFRGRLFHQNDFSFSSVLHETNKKYLIDDSESVRRHKIDWIFSSFSCCVLYKRSVVSNAPLSSPFLVLGKKKTSKSHRKYFAPRQGKGKRSCFHKSLARIRETPQRRRPNNGQGKDRTNRRGN